MDYIDLMFRRPAKLEIEAFDIGAAMVLVLACWIFRIGSG